MTFIEKYVYFYKQKPKAMKKIIILMCVLGSIMSSYTKAQSIANQLIEEEYLVKIFRESQVVFSKIDDVDDFIYVKNMLVVFNTDSCIFESAYIESNNYSIITEKLNPIFCMYVEIIDIYGNKLKLAYEVPYIPIEKDEYPLNDLYFLTPVLDSLLQKTDTCNYAEDTEMFINIGMD
ncbi:MAG: hypothetical protein WCP92_01240 [bacterium]